MKILFLSRAVPFPPDSGPKVKTFNLLRQIAVRHKVTLVSFTDDDDSEARASMLRDLCDRVYTLRRHYSWANDAAAALSSALSGRPFLIERESSRAMHQLLARLISEASAAGEPFHLVHADQLVMAQFAEPLGLPRLLDEHHVLWAVIDRMAQGLEGTKGWLMRREQRLLRHYEGQLCNTFEAVTVVNEEDRQALHMVMPSQRELALVPITVDLEREQPVPRARDARGVLSLSAMHWPPNIEGVCWYANEIHPLVRRVVPEVRFSVCGPQPPAEVRALANRDKSIEVTGYVPDPRSYIARSACLVAPLRSAGGMRVKILEALARGIPVVSTSVGCRGLDLVPGEHLLVADSPGDFADAVTLLLRDPDFGEHLATVGRQRLLEHYNWHSAYPSIDSVYHRIAGIFTERSSQAAQVLPAKG